MNGVTSLCSTKAISVSLGFMMVGGGSEERTEAKRKVRFPIIISSGLEKEL